MAETTEAQAMANRYGNDGQHWTEGGVHLEDACRQAGAVEEVRRDRGGNPLFWRYAFSDGSAILVCSPWWDLEGSRPWVCAGAEEDGEVGTAEDDDV